MMQDPVKDGGGDDRIAKDLIPLAEASVGGQDQCPPFIASGYELEEQMRSMAIDGDIADFVNDQKLGLTVELQAFFDSVFCIGL